MDLSYYFLGYLNININNGSLVSANILLKMAINIPAAHQPQCNSSAKNALTFITACQQISRC